MAARLFSMMCVPNSSSELMACSVIMSDSRFSPMTLQPISACRSPSTCTGSRTLARTMRITLSSITPWRINGSSGRNRPSWKTCRPSGDWPSPPISTTCVVQENSATSLPLWKAGEVTTMS